MLDRLIEAVRSGESRVMVVRGEPGVGKTALLEYRTVSVNAQALVSISISAGSTGPGVTGSVSVRSSNASPRSFPIAGYADHTLDLVVQPSEPFGVLVVMEAGAGVGYLAFRGASYQTL
jgi:hypothetical protein